MAENKNWLLDLLPKIGLSEIATIYGNSPDKKPDEVDLDKIATDFKGNMFAVLKGSDEFKTIQKEAGIVALKKYKKQLNDEYGLEMTREDIDKIDPEDFIKKLKDKHQSEIEASKNGHTKEWQDKYSKLNEEFSGFKKKYDSDTESLKKAVDEEKNRFANMELEAKKEAAFENSFKKINWGKDVDKDDLENKKIIVKTVLNERAYKWDHEGKAFKGENDVITAPDGMTVLKNLDDVISSIGKERKLFQQANAGTQGSQPAAFVPSGDAAIDAIRQKAIDRVAELNKGNV